MAQLAIDVTDLKKSYGDVDAVRGIDLKINVGEIFALLGPNGAGKTTTIEILEGFLTLSGGHVRVLGHDPAQQERAYKEKIGIVLQETEPESFLTVQESVELMRCYYKNPLPLEDILNLTGLGELRDIRPRKLSGGQQRRLDVALGLAGNPELLFLDEPTTGFDPHARREAWEMIRNFKNLGKTVLLTSHYMDEVEHIADRAAIMVQGKIVAEGTPRELAKETSATISFVTDDVKGLPSELATVLVGSGNRYQLVTQEPTATMHKLTGWALERNVELQDLVMRRRTLEDAFVELTTASDEAQA